MAFGQSKFNNSSRNGSYFLSLAGATSLALAALSGCANRTETQLAFPPLADIKVEAEPAYPEAALTDPAAEALWWNEVLLWGRDNRDKVARVCTWAKDLKYEVPADWCG